MRLAKWFGLLLMLGAILIFATPTFADDPFGGPATQNSGDGTTTWSAIYIWDCTNPIAFPPNAARWFKVDAWLYHKLQIALDDQPPTSAANYFVGSTNDQSPNLVNGFWLKVYPPEVLGPNYAYRDQKHRADLLTTADGIRPDGSVINAVGMANHNEFIPEHLLWYEGVFDGWVYLRVENKMPGNASAIVCINRVRYMDEPEPPVWEEEEPSREYISPADRRNN